MIEAQDRARAVAIGAAVEAAKRLAERVVELEALLEQREAELHATDVDRLRALDEIPPLVDGLRCYAVPPTDLRRLVEIARLGVRHRPAPNGADVMLLMTYGELVGLEAGS